MVPKSENRKSLIAQPLSALRVAICYFPMLATIDFNYHSLLQADEIHNIGAYRSLSAKSPTANLSQSQMPPQQAFGVRGILPKIPGSCD
jgi:hypothetical protein